MELFLKIGFLLLTGTMFAEVPFSTHFFDDCFTPVGPASVPKHQAVTSESDSKISLFLRFPKLPEVNLADVYSPESHRGYTDILARINRVEKCRKTESKRACELLFN